MSVPASPAQAGLPPAIVDLYEVNKRGPLNSTTTDDSALSATQPKRLLGVWQPSAVVVGMVVGAGIFRTSALTAQTLSSETAVLIAWALGGVFAIAASLCYAELSTAFPSPGGEYHFLREAFGGTVGFLFAWSRFAIIFTASSAMLAFVGADYIAQIIPMGPAARAGVAIGLILDPHFAQRTGRALQHRRPDGAGDDGCERPCSPSRRCRNYPGGRGRSIGSPSRRRRRRRRRCANPIVGLRLGHGLRHAGLWRLQRLRDVCRRRCASPAT